MLKGNDILDRLLAHAVKITKLCTNLPKNRATTHIAGQLLRSGTAAAPNYAEAVLHAVTYSPSKYENTKYYLNGVDQLPSQSHTEIDCKESFSSSDQYVTLAVRRPFSSIGLAAGVRINL